MYELTEKDREDIRRYVIENSEGLPELEDLPARWRTLKKGLKPDGHPFVEAHKDALIQYYVDCSETRGWAREGLRRLLEETRGQEPELLWRWACKVVRENPKSLPRSRGRRPEHNRNFRIEIMSKLLRRFGLSHEKATEELSEITGLEDNTIRSALRRGRKSRMQ